MDPSQAGNYGWVDPAVAAAAAGYGYTGAEGGYTGAIEGAYAGAMEGAYTGAEAGAYGMEGAYGYGMEGYGGEYEGGMMGADGMPVAAGGRGRGVRTGPPGGYKAGDWACPM